MHALYKRKMTVCLNRHKSDPLLTWILCFPYGARRVWPAKVKLSQLAGRLYGVISTWQDGRNEARVFLPSLIHALAEHAEVCPHDWRCHARQGVQR